MGKRKGVAQKTMSVRRACAAYLRGHGINMLVNGNLPKNAELFERTERSLGLPLSYPNGRPMTRKQRLDRLYIELGINTEDRKYKLKRKAAKKGEEKFYETREWRTVRYKALLKADGSCMACGRSKAMHGIVLHVDHIKPRYHFPELELEESNLQVLCEDCNLGKGAWDQTDWR